MEEEVLFWSRLNGAMASFCHQVALEDDGLQSLVSSMVGDDLEWCGPLALTYTSRKYIETQAQCQELNMRCKFLENSLSNELLVVANLRNKLKQSQTEASDNEWRLQEQIAQLNTALAKEKSQNQLLEMRAAMNTTKRYNQNSIQQPKGINIHEDSHTRADATATPTKNLHNSNTNTSKSKNPIENAGTSSTQKSNIFFEGKENSTTTGKFVRKNSDFALKEQRSVGTNRSMMVDL